MVNLLKIKELKEMPKIVGTIPMMYHRETIYTMGISMNAYANAIDYLYQVICEQQKEIDTLMRMVGEG